MKKNKTLIICLSILIIAIVAFVVFFTIIENNTQNNSTPITSDSILDSETIENLPTTGNDYIINTTSDTTLRIINEYDAGLFTKDKNLLIMFASWCPNCQEEISEIEKILQKYENDENINIILIAHEFEDSINDLIALVENDVDFKNIEVNVDLNIVIRKHLDPEASTIPVSYVVDNNGNVLEKYASSLTLDKANEMLKK